MAATDVRRQFLAKNSQLLSFWRPPLVIHPGFEEYITKEFDRGGVQIYRLDIASRTSST